jgi:hypothetical protein
MIRMLFALVGYACVATVLSAALGVGYLWQSERLNDKRMFQIVAMIHGVELDEKDEAEAQPQAKTPEEEPSLAETSRVRELAMRDYEARQASLERGKTEFDYSLSQMIEQRDRIDEMASELKTRIDQESSEMAAEGVKDVVRDLRVAKPDKGKELLLRLLDRGGADPEAQQQALDEVVQIIQAMPIDTWSDILNRFEGAAELDKLHRIHAEQLEGGEKKRVLQEALKELSAR